MKRILLWVLAPLLMVTSVVLSGAAPVKDQKFDWPQWQGPDRTNLSKETGLLKEWPKDKGPKLVWEAKDLGGGYSTPSVAAGRVFGMSYRGADEGVWALDEATGKELWFQRIAAKGNAGYNEGPRCTPTVDGDLLYALGISGDLACLEVATGKIKWQKNLKKEFNGAVGGWAYSESPLIDGERVLVTPGGDKATIVALNKKTGAVIWKAPVTKGSTKAAYSSIIAVDVEGARQYIQFLEGGVVGISEKGDFLWHYDHFNNKTANCSTPIYRDGYVFAASAYGNGGGLAKLKNEGGKFVAEEVYFSKQMQNHHGGMILVGDYLYGANGDKLTCLEFKTGTMKWEDRKSGKGSLTYADGLIYFRDEKGPIVLIEANPEKYVEISRFEQPDRSGKDAWPHPVIANGKLYIHDQDLLLCYDVKAK